MCIVLPLPTKCSWFAASRVDAGYLVGFRFMLALRSSGGLGLSEEVRSTWLSLLVRTLAILRYPLPDLTNAGCGVYLARWKWTGLLELTLP